MAQTIHNTNIENATITDATLNNVVINGGTYNNCTFVNAKNGTSTVTQGGKQSTCHRHVKRQTNSPSRDYYGGLCDNRAPNFTWASLGLKAGLTIISRFKANTVATTFGANKVKLDGVVMSLTKATRLLAAKDPAYKNSSLANSNGSCNARHYWLYQNRVLGEIENRHNVCGCTGGGTPDDECDNCGGTYPKGCPSSKVYPTNPGGGGGPKGGPKTPSPSPNGGCKCNGKCGGKKLPKLTYENCTFADLGIEKNNPLNCVVGENDYTIWCADPNTQKVIWIDNQYREVTIPLINATNRVRIDNPGLLNKDSAVANGFFLWSFEDVSLNLRMQFENTRRGY